MRTLFRTILLSFSLCLLSIGGVSHAKTIYINPEKELVLQFQTEGARYVLSGDINLNGETIVLPAKAALIFNHGVVNNGRIKGCANRIQFDSPFLGSDIVVEGCFIKEKILYSVNILAVHNYDDNSIHNLFNLAKPGTKIVFEKGVYKDVSPIHISKEVELDFSNSVIQTAIDENSLSCSVFITDIEPQKTLKGVRIANVTIDGLYPRYGMESGIGPRRNAIRLINIKNVVLDNVAIKNYRYGTSGPYERNLKNCHMAGVCFIKGYKKCTIQNCSISKSTGEGFFLVPGDDKRNYTQFRENNANNFYGTLLTLIDGRCLVENNHMDTFGLSGMNVFCYNSIIRNNSFKNGARFNCIDITENGLYWPHNVQIYDNVADNCVGFIMVSGHNISISGNTCYNPKSGNALTIYGYVPTDANSKEYLIPRESPGGETSIYVRRNKWNCKGGIETYPGCNANITIEDNEISIEPNEVGKEYRGSVVELNDCKNVTIKGNQFVNSFTNSITRSNVYLTMLNCNGDIIIKNNKFDRTLPTPYNSSYFLFTQNVNSKDITIENNQSNIPGITVRTIDGGIKVQKNKIVHNNGGIIIDKSAFE